MLSEISREAILSAVKKCDQIGREQFLAKYGFQHARSYFLVLNGRYYDSKAIVGVAHEFLMPEQRPLAAADFSGGEASVAPLLKKLGFEIADKDPTMPLGIEERVHEKGRILTNPFTVGQLYTRRDICSIVGAEEEAGKGDWATGYHRHGDDWFIFCNIGIPGRTGHDYGDHWDGAVLEWRGKTNSHLHQTSIQHMLSGTSSVHVFTRETDRGAFTYRGAATAKEVRDTIPVTVLWQFGPATAPPTEILPQEVAAPEKYHEGTTRTVSVNVYERNPRARQACIDHYGPRCSVCGFDFGKVYGELGVGWIEVHHLKQLSSIGEQYEVDPIKDLRPTCSNCHVMLHRREPPLTIEELQDVLRQNGILS